MCAEIWNTQEGPPGGASGLRETLCRHNYKETVGFTVQRGGLDGPRCLHTELLVGKDAESDLCGFPASWGDQEVSVSKGEKCWKVWQGRVGRV